MLTIGIDIGKNSHFFAGVDGATGEIVIVQYTFGGPEEK